MASMSARVDATGEPLRLLHVHAHPDDESSKGAATTAKYRAEGVEVLVATCTGGERGDILNPAMNRADVRDDMAAIRKAEMEAARKILDVQQVWLGFVDSGLPEGDPTPALPEGCFGLVDPEQACEPLVRVIRQFRPHVVTTYDENGGYPHPDHIMCHRLTMAAVDAAPDPSRFPAAGKPWQVLKVYYHMGFHRRRFAAIDEMMHAHGLDSPYRERLQEWEEDLEFEKRLTTFVPCAEYFDVRDDALRAHATQVDPNGQWFAVPNEIQAKGWPTEDYQLVRSMVPVQLPENDLFAGIAAEDGQVVPASEGSKVDTWAYSI